MALPLSPQVFSILTGLVAETCGLLFDGSHMEIFADKVSGRAADAGFESLLDYYYFLRYDPGGAAELDALIDTLVVGETYLFRELVPLEVAVSEFVTPLLQQARRPRIWCAASATGEEPHTVAMLLAARRALDKVDLIASDISNAALARARQGRFSQRAIRDQVPDFARPWLSTQGDRVVVEPHLTRAIDWRRVNLLDAPAIASMGKFDVVLCRNVLIYFGDDTTRRVLDSLAGVLNPGGVLLVGVSESLLRFGTSLACEERGGVFLYRTVP